MICGCDVWFWCFAGFGDFGFVGCLGNVFGLEFWVGVVCLFELFWQGLFRLGLCCVVLVLCGF